jgi:hypothetical protein
LAAPSTAFTELGGKTILKQLKRSLAVVVVGFDDECVWHGRHTQTYRDVFMVAHHQAWQQP